MTKLRKTQHSSNASTGAAKQLLCAVLIIAAAALFTGIGCAEPAYEVSTVGMVNVIPGSSGEYYVAENTPYILVPFNITLTGTESARGYFIRDSGSTAGLSSLITGVTLTYDGWNIQSNTEDGIKIAAASSVSEQFTGSSNRVFIVNLSTASLAAGAHTLRFSIDTAWSPKNNIDDSQTSDWKKITCPAEFTFIVKNPITLTYDGNGHDSGSMPQETYSFGDIVTLCENAYGKTGYIYFSWNTKADGTGYYIADKAALILYESLTLYAQWSPKGKSGIYGNIINATGPVTITLNGTDGSTRQKTFPAGRVSYIIEDVSPGTYNLKAEYTNAGYTYIITELVDVEKIPVRCDLSFPDKKLQTIVLISDNGITPNIAVGELNKEVTAQTASLTDTQSAQLIFSAQANIAKDIPEESALILEKMKADGIPAVLTNTLYINATIYLIKYQGSTEISRTAITETQNILEVCIAYDFSGKKDIYVYRLHNGTAESLTQLSSKPVSGFIDGTYYPDREKNVVRVYADKYSCYAIAYSPVSGGKGGGSGSSVWLTAKDGQNSVDITGRYADTILISTSDKDIAAVAAVNPDYAAKLQIKCAAAQQAGIPLVNAAGAPALIETEIALPEIETNTFTRVYEITPVNPDKPLTQVIVTVPVNDVLAAGLTADDVTVYCYQKDSDIWIPLDTLQITTDKTTFYYTVESGTSSLYGVLIKRINTETPAPKIPVTAESPVPLIAILAGLTGAAAAIRTKRKEP